MRYRARIGGGLVGLLVLLAPSSLRSQETGVSNGDTRLWLREGIGAVHVQAGSYQYDPVPQLPGLEGSAIWSLGLTFFPGSPFPSNAIGFDFSAWGLSRSYQSVIDGAADAETQLRTEAFALGGRIGLPPSSPIGAYAIAGLTYASHTMEVEVLPAWFFPNIGQTREEEDGGWAPYWGVALDARYRDFAVGIEQRWIRTHGSFDEPFSMSGLSLGGSTLLFGVSWYGGRFSR